MQKEEIISHMKSLNLPQGSYVVFGSCPLAIAGLREARDIDLLVSKDLLEKLKQEGWKELLKGAVDKPLVSGIFEAHDNNCNFSSYSPTLDQLLATATIIDGIPFASLAEVKKWKAASGRPQDIADIELIDTHGLRSKS